MGRPKKLNLEGMSLANGKIWDEKNLNTKLGHAQPYKEMSPAEYEEKIKLMDTFDLQTHASQVLVPLKNNRELLIANLIKEFNIRKVL